MYDLTGRVIGAAIEVHRATGPGLLESAYEVCLAAELGARGIRFRRQVEVPITYREQRLDTGYRLDFLLGGYTIALLINFNTRYLGEGSIRRLVLNHKEEIQRIPRLQR